MYVLVRKSYIYSTAARGGDGGSPATALALLDEAQAAAGSRAPLFLCTWISARQAKEHAATGDARASHQDLSRAERTLGAARTPGGCAFSPWDEARLAGFRGSCALLGWPRQAVIALEGALVGTTSLLSPRSAVLTDCAAAYARQQELETACALLTESLTIAGQAGLRPYVQRILGVRQRLAFCAASPAMRQLDERLRVLLWVRRCSRAPAGPVRRIARHTSFGDEPLAELERLAALGVLHSTVHIHCERPDLADSSRHVDGGQPSRHDHWAAQPAGHDARDGPVVGDAGPTQTLIGPRVENHRTDVPLHGLGLCEHICCRRSRGDVNRSDNPVCGIRRLAAVTSSTVISP